MEILKKGKIYFEILKPYIKYQIMIMVLMILGTMIYVVDPIIMQVVIDKVLILGEYKILKHIVVILIFFFVFGILVQYIIGFLNTFISQGMQKTLRSKLLNDYIKSSYDDIQKMSVGNFISRLTEDASIIITFVSSTLFEVSGDLLNIIVTLGLMVYFSEKLTVIALIISVSQIFLSLKFSKKVRKNQEEMREMSATHLSFLKNIFNSIKFIKSYNRYSYEEKSYEGLQKKVITLSFQKFKIYFSYETCLNTVSFLGSMCLMGVGIYEIYQGRLSVGTLFVFDTIAEKFYLFSKNLINLNINLQKVFVSLERLEDIFKMSKEDFGGNKEIGILNENTVLYFDNVDFNYEELNYNDANVIDRFCMEFEKGKNYVIVGESGTGKSTIFNLIIQLYTHQCGKIILGDSEIKEYSIEDIRNKITYVFQEPYLFEGTLKENILLDRRDLEDEKLMEIIRLCRIEKIIEDDPKYLEKDILDCGNNLSAGQKQRICLARALTRDSQLYLFDEAFANLDSKLEKEVFNNILEYLDNKTKIFITHNTQLMKEFDCIIIMKKGKILDFGKHEELLKRCESYKEIHVTGEVNYGYQ